MRHAMRWQSLFFALVVTTACEPLRYPLDEPDGGERDASIRDASAGDARASDAGQTDAGTRDAGEQRDAGELRDGGEAPDAGARDAGPAVMHTLSLTIAGGGAGRVVSSPPGIDCPGTCDAEFPEGVEIQLQANPTRTSRVGGWSLPCNRAEVCATMLGADASVDVFFQVKPRVFVGDSHSCALNELGRLRCWGENGSGQLGYDNTTDVGDGVGPSVQDVGEVDTGFGEVVVDAALGRFHTCAVYNDGRLRCWGAGFRGALGYNDTENVGDDPSRRITLAGDVPVGGLVVQVQTHGDVTCALLSTGAVRCWGTSVTGAHGHGSTPAIGNGTGPSIITAGDLTLSGSAVVITHRCALLATGAIECWDGGIDGTDQTVFRSISVGEPALDLVSGDTHDCALLSGGRVRCWGRNAWGQLGYNNTTNVNDGIGPSIPVAGDVPVGELVSQIATGHSHTCAILASGGLRCWGDGGDGRLGYGNTDNVGDGMGLDVAMAGVVALGAAAAHVAPSTLPGRHTCAVTAADEVYCWGNGGSGRLGYGSEANVGDGAGLSVASAGPVLSL
jgi:alpha-tubulin suppressor-like RCC1 family protein